MNICIYTHTEFPSEPFFSQKEITSELSQDCFRRVLHSACPFIGLIVPLLPLIQKIAPILPFSKNREKGCLFTIFVYTLNMSYFKLKSALGNQKCTLINIKSALFLFSAPRPIFSLGETLVIFHKPIFRCVKQNTPKQKYFPICLKNCRKLYFSAFD